MTHSLNNRLAAKPALDVRTYPPRRTAPRKPGRQELESKLAELQRDYAELHTSIFEAAQVHRRRCAPRLVRLGDFEFASEISRCANFTGFLTVGGRRRIVWVGDVVGKASPPECGRRPSRSGARAQALRAPLDRAGESRRVSHVAARSTGEYFSRAAGSTHGPAQLLQRRTSAGDASAREWRT